MQFGLGREPPAVSVPGVERKLRATPRRRFWPSLTVFCALTASCPIGNVGAQQSNQPQISVAPTIAAEPASQSLLAIQIGPPHIVPKKSFVSLRGLPPSASLTEGHAIGPGSWAVPLVGLPTLKVNVPAGISGRAEIVISLIGMDGRLLAEAKTALVVGPAGKIPSQDKALPEPAQPHFAIVAPPALAPARKEDPEASSTVPRPAPASAEEKVRAESALALGEKYFIDGRVLVAREFFKRAVDAGLAAGALRLAATYDPIELERLQVQGIVPDRALARRWYLRARELGAPEAEERLARLGGN
jgi:hypothetical protein